MIPADFNYFPMHNDSNDREWNDSKENDLKMSDSKRNDGKRNDSSENHIVKITINGVHCFEVGEQLSTAVNKKSAVSSVEKKAAAGSKNCDVNGNTMEYCSTFMAPTIQQNNRTLQNNNSHKNKHKSNTSKDSWKDSIETTNFINGSKKEEEKCGFTIRRYGIYGMPAEVKADDDGKNSISPLIDWFSADLRGRSASDSASLGSEAKSLSASSSSAVSEASPAAIVARAAANAPTFASLLKATATAAVASRAFFHSASGFSSSSSYSNLSPLRWASKQSLAPNLSSDGYSTAVTITAAASDDDGVESATSSSAPDYVITENRLRYQRNFETLNIFSVTPVSEEKIRASDGIVRLQAGTNKYDSQKGMTGFGTARRETTKMVDTKHPEYDHEKPDQSEIPLQSGTNKFASQKGMTGFGTSRRETTRIVDTNHPDYNPESSIDSTMIPYQMGSNKYASQKGMTGFGQPRWEVLDPSISWQNRKSQGMVRLQSGTNRFASQAGWFGGSGFGTPRNTTYEAEAGELPYEEMRKSEAIIPSQAGWNKGDSQRGMTSFGAPRDVRGKHLKRIWELEYPEEAEISLDRL